MITREEAEARWEQVRCMMARLDLDAVVAIDLSRDEILLGNQRWLTGYIAVGGPAAVVLYRDGRVDLLSERIGQPAAGYYKTNEFPIELVSGSPNTLLAQRLAEFEPRRVGIAEPATFSHALGATLQRAAPALTFVDVSPDFEGLRLRKSSHELALVRQSCAIADAVWQRVPDMFAVGRRFFEITADIEQLVRAAGAEGGFHLLLPLPFLGRGIQSLVNPARIERNARYLLEISPRFEGYYSQLTIPVTTYAEDDRAFRAYDDIIAAKRNAEPLMRPGVDLTEIAKLIEADLANKGHSMAGLSLGHFCGMALEEPRHDPATSFLLEDGMTLIFHPTLGDSDLRSLMRAETYLITASGAEKLNRYEGGMLAIT